MKFSIIVPIYNRESTLSRCIESVLDQKYVDFECILVDDGSTDNSLVVCEKYAQKDGRIKVIHKENGGVGSARNAGIDKAKGEWMFFLDSDDYITEYHLSSLIGIIDKHQNIDLVICGYQRISSDGVISHHYNETICKSRSQIKEFLCCEEILMDTPWMNRIYRRKIAIDNNIRYDTNLPISEDRLFFYQYVIHIKGIASINSDSYVIDATIGNSLSKKILSTQIIAYSIVKMSKATKDIILYYHIEPELSLYLWKNIWEPFFSMIDYIYNSQENIFSAIKKQKKFYDDVFDIKLYNSIKGDERIKCYMSNRSYKDILYKRFFSFNLRKLFRSFIYHYKVVLFL